MIEIIGMEHREERVRKQRSLPKNVRQIGVCGEKRKIYIEDYVVTYLNKMAEPSQVQARGAILYGDICDTEEGTAVFISGAVEAGNLEFDMDETIFNEAIWEELLEKGEKYFPDQEVIGWFLSRMGFSVDANQKIINTHMKNFPGDYKVLYMIDSLEKEDAMYICENQQVIRQNGYYIYYEKNSAMQEYMLHSEKGKRPVTEEQMAKSEIRRDKKIVNSYRKMRQYSRETKKQDALIRGIRAACAALIFIMGIYIAGKLGDRFVNMGVDDYAITTFQAVKNVFLSDSPDIAEEEIKQGQTEIHAASEPASEEVTDWTKETEETVAFPKPLYYTVKKGDTLAGISRKMYSTDKYTSRIAQANNLINEDQIYVGQKILIPSIE